MSTYNARVSFKGEGSFTFTLPIHGEIQINAGRDIYIKGLTQSGVEALRQLRPLLLDHKLNAKQDGCYKVIDLQDNLQPVKSKLEYNYRPIQSNATIADLKSELVSGPIPEEEIEAVLVTAEPESTLVEEDKNPGDYILTSTKHKGKKISDLTRGQLSGNMPKFNAEDLAAVKAYKEFIK